MDWQLLGLVHSDARYGATCLVLHLHYSTEILKLDLGPTPTRKLSLCYERKTFVNDLVPIPAKQNFNQSKCLAMLF